MTATYAAGRHAARAARDAERAATVRQLAAQGLTPKKIAVQIQMSKSEIRAILQGA